MPVARAEEVLDNVPVQVLVAGDAWVLTRMDGRLTAFEDRCPHQRSPLSDGAVTRAADGTPRLSCAYHGWRFDAAGRCDLIPGRGARGRFGKRAVLRPAYGVTEKYGLIWLAGREPLAPLPEFPEWAGDAIDEARARAVRTQASAGQVVAGFLDAAFTMPSRDGGEDYAPRVIKTTGPHATVHARLELPRARIAILLACQPEDWGSTRVFTLVTRAGPAGDATRLARFLSAADQSLLADLATLERGARAVIPLEDRGAEAGAPADRLSVAWRRVMARAVYDQRHGV